MSNPYPLQRDERNSARPGPAVPAERRLEGAPHFQICCDPPSVGDDVYFGGFSEELDFPFQADRALLPTTNGVDNLKRLIGSRGTARVTGPIIKHGVVGNARVGTWSSGEEVAIQQTQFYIDNVAHQGASGGPIVTADGILRGIVSMRPTVVVDSEVDGDMRFQKLTIPAGSTLGIGLEPILAVLKWSSTQ